MATQWAKLFVPNVIFKFESKKALCLSWPVPAFSGCWGCSKVIYTLECNAAAAHLPSAAVSFCCPGTRHRFLSGGRRGGCKLLSHIPKSSSFSSVPLFTLFQRCDRAGWVETIQPGETRRHWHTLSSQMCSQEWWRRHELVGSVLDFMSHFDSRSPTGKHVSGCRYTIWLFVYKLVSASADKNGLRWCKRFTVNICGLCAEVLRGHPLFHLTVTVSVNGLHSEICSWGCCI